jgi:methylated-DNA-[protein]-cysteine S-methyltransferase
MIYSKTIETPIGELGLYADETHLLRITFCAAGENDNSNKIIENTAKELQEYFAGNRTDFSIPLNMEGTVFRKQVWKQLLKIPFGETISYQELAERVGSIKKARAVGNANHYNPIPIIVPCHRVVRKSGDLGGFGGGLDVKELLLELEKK